MDNETDKHIDSLMGSQTETNRQSDGQRDKQMNSQANK